MITFPIMQRRNGIRRLSDLTTPPFGNVSELELPKDSLVHHIGTDEVSLGPEPEGVLFKHYSGRILVEHIQTLRNPVGNPKPDKSTPPNALAKQYHRRFRIMRPLHKFEKSDADSRSLLVENYSHLNSLNRYMRSIYANYYKWLNVYNTVFSVAKERGTSERQQFILAELPKHLPSLAALKKTEASGDKLTRESLEIFGSANSVLILEIWKWLGENRDSSVIAQVKDVISKINIIWLESGHWFNMNLGVVLELSSDDVDDEGSSLMQRRFLRLLMTLMECRTSTVSAIEESTVDSDDRDIKVDEDNTSSKKDEVLDEATIDADLSQLDKITESIEKIESDDISGINLDITDQTESIINRINVLSENGNLSAAQNRRLIKLTEKAKELPNPYGEGTLDDFRKIKPKDLELSEKNIKLLPMAGVTDESMLESTLLAFDSQYLDTVFDKDIANAALSLQSAGIIVTDYNVEEVEDAVNHYKIVTMKLTPVDGESSTIRFRVPVVNKDGIFTANNVNYRLRKQRTDKPIRKVAPHRVALTSYYAKVFVERSEKSVVNYGKWLNKNILAIGLDKDNSLVTDVKHTKTFVSDVKLPRVYTILSQQYREFTINKTMRIYVDYTRRNEVFGEELIKANEKQGLTFIGMDGKVPIMVDENNTFYRAEGGKPTVIGQIESLLELDSTKAPVEIAEFRLFRNSIPVGIVLGQHFGLTKLMSLLEVKPRRVPLGTRFTLADDEYALRFSDETLIFTKENQKAQLILAGYNRYHRSIRRYTVDSFDDVEVYANVMEDSGLRIGFIRELQLAMEMFIDPITKELLVEMGEPQTLPGLLIRACELLLIDWHRAENDMLDMRVRGYERMAGAVYSEMLKGVRRYRSRGAGTTAKLEINPEAVWQVINQDSSIAQIEESNPIQNLKEKELVTYLGTGGRNTVSMVKGTRSFHRSDMGVISEATVDSASVGVNAYLSANPQFKNLRGLANEYESGKTGNSSMISTSALLAPTADVDDPKRVNFISIQNTHTVSAKGYKPSPLRTGYERVVPHRVDDLFAYTAKQGGEVIKVDKNHITIKYSDTEVVKLELGTRYGTVPGMTVPHEIKTDLEVGDKLKIGDIVTYNEGYFQPDPLNPNQVLMKTGIMAKTAIMERSHTFEDSSVVSERIAKELSTNITKVRSITVQFDQTIRGLVQVGTEVDLETILCTIENSVTSGNDLFDEESIDSLRLLSSNTPKAKYAGKVERIEVFYHGEIEDMSESLQHIVNDADKDRIKRLKASGKKATTGQVDGNVRIEKDALDLDSLSIRVYITGSLDVSVGDKGVFGNQMKTVFGYVMSGINRTKSGEDLDAMFAYLSISNRIVLSPEVMGTTNTLLRVMSKKVAEKYFNVKGK